MIYRADHSTETAQLKVHHDISSALDESHAVALCHTGFVGGF